jgi:acetyl-CoA carboxylase beta subunit
MSSARATSNHRRFGNANNSISKYNNWKNKPKQAQLSGAIVNLPVHGYIAEVNIRRSNFHFMGGSFGSVREARIRRNGGYIHIE